MDIRAELEILNGGQERLIISVNGKEIASARAGQGSPLSLAVHGVKEDR